MLGLGSMLAAGSLLSCISSGATAAVLGFAAPTFGDIVVRSEDLDSGSGPSPCPLLSAVTENGQIDSSNSTALTNLANISSLSAPHPITGPSPPPCTYVASWALYKQTVKSLATPAYQLGEKSGQYIIDASMDAKIDHIVILFRHGNRGAFKILQGFPFDENEGWCKITLQRGVWFYVTVVMRHPGVRGVVRLSKVNIDSAGSIASLGDTDPVDVD